MAETKTSGSWNLDGIAAKLQAKADELLKSTSSTAGNEGTDDDAAASTGGKREALRNVANIVKGQAEKGLETSKEYLTQVVGKVSSTASAQFADAKEKGVTHFTTASESANVQYAAVKEKASTHLTGVQTNINKAIAQGQAKATSTGEETTDRELPTAEEPLTFPYSLIAWFVSLCHGKGTDTTTATSGSTTSTTKDLSAESLHNAAVTLTDALEEGVESVGNKSHTAGEGSAETTT